MLTFFVNLNEIYLLEFHSSNFRKCSDFFVFFIKSLHCQTASFLPNSNRSILVIQSIPIYSLFITSAIQ